MTIAVGLGLFVAAGRIYGRGVARAVLATYVEAVAMTLEKAPAAPARRARGSRKAGRPAGPGRRATAEPG